MHVCAEKQKLKTECQKTTQKCEKFWQTHSIYVNFLSNFTMYSIYMANFTAIAQKRIIPYNCEKVELYASNAHKRQSQAVYSIYPNSLYTG